MGGGEGGGMLLDRPSSPFPAAHATIIDADCLCQTSGLNGLQLLHAERYPTIAIESKESLKKFILINLSLKSTKKNEEERVHCHMRR